MKLPWYGHIADCAFRANSKDGEKLHVVEGGLSLHQIPPQFQFVVPGL